MCVHVYVSVCRVTCYNMKDLFGNCLIVYFLYFTLRLVIIFTSNAVSQLVQIRSVKGHNIESVFISLCVLMQVSRVVEQCRSYIQLFDVGILYLPCPPSPSPFVGRREEDEE